MNDASQLNDEESQIFEAEKKKYVNSYPKIFLEVFERNFKFRNALLVNLDKPEIKDGVLRPAGKSDEKEEELYCVGMFVKPGKHKYVIRSPSGEMV